MSDLGNVGSALLPLRVNHSMGVPTSAWPDVSVRATPPAPDSGGGGGEEGVYVPQGSMTFG